MSVMTRNIVIPVGIARYVYYTKSFSKSFPVQ
jgi:hypothetical protein